MSIRVIGRLAAVPEARVMTDGTAVVVYLIEQPGACPVHCTHRIGQGPAAQVIAASTARGMRPGDQVTAFGTVLKPCTVDAVKVLRLQQAIVARAQVPNHHEPLAA